MSGGSGNTARIAVTGQAGFIGRRLVAALKARGDEVVLLEGDVRSKAIWDTRFDTLYHLAAVLPAGFRADPEEAFDVNTRGTLNALEACRACGANLVFSSTCAVYGPTGTDRVKEDHVLAPQSPYGVSKLIGEHLCGTYTASYGVRCTIFRLFNVYGPRQHPDFLIPYLVSCARDGKEAKVRHPDSSRDFVHLNDVVRALVAASTQETPLRILNLGSGHLHSVRNVLQMLGRAVGRPLAWREARGGADPTPALCADSGRAVEALGWTASVDLETGLGRLLRPAAD
jgi:UDP-glucose 4-epimerase